MTESFLSRNSQYSIIFKGYLYYQFHSFVLRNKCFFLRFLVLMLWHKYCLLVHHITISNCSTSMTSSIYALPFVKENNIMALFNIFHSLFQHNRSSFLRSSQTVTSQSRRPPLVHSRSFAPASLMAENCEDYDDIDSSHFFSPGAVSTTSAVIYVKPSCSWCCMLVAEINDRHVYMQASQQCFQWIHFFLNIAFSRNGNISYLQFMHE